MVVVVDVLPPAGVVVVGPPGGVVVVVPSGAVVVVVVPAAGAVAVLSVAVVVVSVAAVSSAFFAQPPRARPEATSTAVAAITVERQVEDVMDRLPQRQT